MNHYIVILLLIILLVIGSKNNKSKYNNKKKELYNNYQPLMFTEESIILREHFFSKSEVSDTNELKLLYDYLRKIKLSPINITYSKYDIPYKSFGLFLSNIPFSINQEEIISKSSVRFTMKNTKVILNVYSDKNKKQLMNELISIIRFMGSLSKIRLSKLTLNLYLFSNKKVLEKASSKKTLNRNEINSGYCQLGDETDIVIYREEELIKVTIHELIHAFRYDNIKDSQEIIKYYQKKYNISSDKINSNEAYTEIWANIINCFIISQRVKRSQYNLFLILIALEREFCNYQSEKIFDLTNLSKEKIDINEKTNVLSYFIIRCELYQKLTQFLKFCRLYNKNYIQLYNKNKWYNLLKKNKLLKMNKKWNKINHNFLINTMRMSLNEIIF